MRLRRGHGYENVPVVIEPLLEVSKFSTATLSDFILPQAMDTYVRSRLVHFATLDIEGAEYGILDELKYGGVFDKAGVVFFQGQ